ncbi:hypothetical protein [Pectinatus frisingensis]|uniref:hypothetical protein n=1 Tax=Pectinatus frisingensis TaxID=865 RepID=UPI0018C7988C|nr:hypothetical protein [Pectinatus frisingensis]
MAPNEVPPEVQDSVFMQYADHLYQKYNGNIDYMADAHYAGETAADEHYANGTLPTNDEGEYPSQSQYASNISNAVNGDDSSNTTINYDNVHPNTTDQSVTDMDDLRPESVYGTNMLGQWMMNNFGTPLEVTGAAEKGYHAQSANGHGHEDGWKLDVSGEGLMPDSEAGDAFKQYCNDNGWSCNWEQNHWDIDFSGSDSRDQQSGFTGNLFNSMMAAFGDDATNHMYSGQHDVQTIDYHTDDYKSSPSFWSALASNFMDSATTTGFADAAQSLWGNLFHSTNHFGAVSNITADDVKYVKEALAGDSDTQKFCLLNGRDSEEVRWLVNQKLVDKRRQAEVASWRAGNQNTLTRFAVSAAGAAGYLADPINLLPVGEAYKGLTMIGRIGEALYDTSKAARIASVAARTGIDAAIATTVDNGLKEKFGGEHPEYGWSAAQAFLGGAVLGSVGGLFGALKGGSKYAEDVAKVADTTETKGMMSAVDLDTSKVSSETIGAAQKIHDADFGKTVDSPYYKKLEANNRVIAASYEDARKLVSQAAGIELPKATKAFYVPNEDYTMLIKDNIKSTEVDNVLAHEFGVHAGLQKVIGDEAYTKLMDDIGVKSNKDGTVWNQARRKSGSYDPEETLAYAVENDMLPKGFTNKVSSLVNKGFKSEGISAKVTPDKIKDMLSLQADAAREASSGIHYNPDGSTAFAGIKYSKDNLLNANMFDAFYNLEKPVTKVTQGGLPKWFPKFLGKAMDMGASGTAINSAANVIRAIAPSLWDDARGRGLGFCKTISAETNKERLSHLMYTPYIKYVNARQNWCLNHKSMGQAAQMAFDKLATLAYNAKYAGNKANIPTEFDKEVMEAVNHMKSLRDLQIELGKRSATDVGSNADNLIDKDWEPLDHELWRQTDNDLRMQFLGHFNTYEEGLNALTDYYKTFAKTDVIKDKLQRVKEQENAKIQEANDKIPEGSKREPQELIDTKVTDEEVKAWLDEHAQTAANYMLKGNMDSTIKQNINQLGALSFLKERIPLDTTGVMQMGSKDNPFEFSFDNNLRDYNMDSIVQKNISRFAGEASIKNVFGTEKGLRDFLEQAKKELKMASDNGSINRRTADSNYKAVENGIYELRGMKPNADVMGKFGALCRIFRNISYAKNGANMGFAQLGELGGTMAYGGAAQLAHVFEPLGKFVDKCRWGKLKQEEADDIEKNIFGSTIESQIFNMNYGDRVIRDALTQNNSLVNKALTMAGDMSANLGKLTSSVNMLPKMTDAMLRGMRTQSIVDSMDWAFGKTFSKTRNPFSAAKLKASHISSKDAEDIKAALQKYGDNSKDNFKLDYNQWQQDDPQTFMKWYGMMQTQTERGILSGSRLGNKAIFKDANPLFQMMMQFKDYNLRACNAMTLRALTAKDLDDGMATALSIITNTASYAARAGLMYSMYKASGMDDEAQKYYDNMFSEANLMRAAAFRSTFIGSPLSIPNDIGEAMQLPYFNGGSIRTTVDRKGTTGKETPDNVGDAIGNFVSQAPALKEAGAPLDALRYFYNASNNEANKRDFRKALQALPVPNLMPFNAYINHVVDQSGYPDKRPKQ